MGVWKPQKSRFWHYEFQAKGRRFYGSTGVENRRAAEAVERKIRQDVALGLHDSDAAITLDEAAGLWWDEVGQHLATAVDVDRRLKILLRLIGPKTLLVDIGTKHVARAIELRRGETYQKAPDKKGADGKLILAKRYPIANATVNADIIVTLRRIHQRARDVWEVTPLKAINWKELVLPEPEPEVRIYSAEQQAAWRAECDPVAADALDALLRYGMRFNELFFPPQAFDPAGPRVTLNKRKKGAHLLPLTAEDGRRWAARAGRAKAAQLDTIWCEEKKVPATSTTPARVELVPLTYYGLQARLRSAAKRAKVDGDRLIHGARHHAGTVMLGKSGNLKLAQQLLGHADIKSTLRYAHALEGDLRKALEVQSSPEIVPNPDAEDHGNPLQRKA